MNRNDHERYAQRKAAGICVKCGLVTARPGKTHCQRCADRNKAWHIKSGGADQQAARYYQRKADGVCTSCGKRPAEIGLLCGDCRVKSRAWVKNWYSNQKARRVSNG